MMKKLPLILVFCGAAAYAQPAFVQATQCAVGAQWCFDTTSDYSTAASIVTSFPQATSVRAIFKTDVATTEGYFECGLPGQPYIMRATIFGDLAATDPRFIRLSGMAPTTTYQCRVGAKATATNLTAWSDPQTITTAARAADAFDPIPDPPLPDTTIPVINGNTYTVDPANNCTNALSGTTGGLQQVINAAQSANQNLNHLIIFPAGAVCTGNITFGARTGPGWIIMQSSAVGTTNFPPEGVRLNPDRYGQYMGHIVGGATSVSYKVPADANSAVFVNPAANYIRLIGIVIHPPYTVDNDISRAATCSPPTAAPVTLSSCSTAAGNTIVCTIPATTGITAGQKATISAGDNGMPGLTGDLYISNADDGNSATPANSPTVPTTIVTFRTTDNSGTFTGPATFTIANASVKVGDSVIHGLKTGRIVTISGSGLTNANAQWTIEAGPATAGAEAETFMLLSSGGTVSGSPGACTASIPADMLLTACRAASGGVIECDTARPHGLVTGTVVKVLSPAPASPFLRDQWDDYSGTYGFSRQTNKVTVVDADTIQFDNTTANGTYEGGARLLIDANDVGVAFNVLAVTNDPRSRPSHIILDRSWIHRHKYIPRSSFNVRMDCDQCAMIESVVDVNAQWQLSIPGTVTDQRPFAFGWTNGMSVTFQNAHDVVLFRNNYVGYFLEGIFADNNSNSIGPVQNISVIRNTFELPKRMMGNLSNPDWDGMVYRENRQAFEVKGCIGCLVRGNRGYGGYASSNSAAGGAWLLSPRTNKQIVNRVYGGLIEYNTSISSGGITVLGGDTSDAIGNTPATSKVTVRHNIVFIDGMRISNQGGAATFSFGNCFNAHLGFEDLVIANNLCVARGTDAQAIFMADGRSAGLRLKNNVFTYQVTRFTTIGGNVGALTALDGSITFPANTASMSSHWRNTLLALGTTTTVNGTPYLHLDPASRLENNVWVIGNKGTMDATTAQSGYLLTTSAANHVKSDCDLSLAPVGGLNMLNNDRIAKNNVCFDAGRSLGATGVDSFYGRVMGLKLTVDPFVLRWASDKLGDVRLAPFSPFKSGWKPATSTWAARPLAPVVGQRWTFSDTNCSGVAGASTTCVYTGPLGWSASTDACTLYGQCLAATDGADIGPDMDALESAQGLVKNARVITTTTTTAQLAYLAPDSAACYLDYWTGSNTPTRVSDGGGARSRAPVITGLLSGTPYTIRVQCAVEQPELTATTK